MLLSGIRRVEDLQQVSPIRRLAIPCGQAAEFIPGYKSFQVSDFLRATDQKPLPMLDRAHELRRLKQRIVGSGVEPGIAAAELHDMKLFNSR